MERLGTPYRNPLPSPSLGTRIESFGNPLIPNIQKTVVICISLMLGYKKDHQA